MFLKWGTEPFQDIFQVLWCYRIWFTRMPRHRLISWDDFKKTARDLEDTYLNEVDGCLNINACIVCIYIYKIYVHRISWKIWAGFPHKASARGRLDNFQKIRRTLQYPSSDCLLVKPVLSQVDYLSLYESCDCTNQSPSCHITTSRLQLNTLQIWVHMVGCPCDANTGLTLNIPTQ